jgi:hypothetical protein
MTRCGDNERHQRAVARRGVGFASFEFLFSLALLTALQAATVSCLSTYNQWTPVSLTVEVPTARAFHTCTLIQAPCGPVLLVFGGANQEANGQFAYLGDTWVFDLAQNQWYANQLAPVVAPLERAGHSAVQFDNRTLVIVGGQNSFMTLAEVWLFQINVDATCDTFTVIGGWAQASITCADGLCPESRWGHSALMLGSHMYMVGGSTSVWFNAFTTSLSFCNMTLWRLSRTASGFAWSPVPAYSSSGLPPPRAGAYATVIGPDSFLLASGWVHIAPPPPPPPPKKRGVCLCVCMLVDSVSVSDCERETEKWSDCMSTSESALFRPN